MKKLILPVAAFSMLFLTSCGGSEICGCVDSMLEMAKEMKATNGDMSKMEEIEAKYKDDFEKCQKIDEGKTDEEKQANEDEAKKCDSWKELESMR